MRFRAPVASFAWAALLAAAVSAFSGTADAQNFSQFIGFGDSTVDSGWYYTHPHDTNPALENLYKASQAIGGGISTTPGGPMNSQVLASLFGLTAIPVGEPGGTNYAAGGAANINYSNYTTLAPNTVSQIQSYLAAAGGVANSSALYMISSGGNDIHGAICPGGVCAANAAQLATNSADALVAAIAQLRAAGAQYFVVTINYGAVPGAATGTPAAQTFAVYDRALYGGLSSAGINFVPVSGKVIADAIDVNPGLFGITNTQPGSPITHTGGACVNPNPALITSAWSIYCTTLVAPNAQQTYLFADDLHYTAAGQLIEGDYAYSLIVAPQEMSYLAEVPVKTRLALVYSIFDQIEISGRGRAVGTFNAWIAGDVASLSINSGAAGFPNDPGVPAMVTVGVDYMWAPHWLVGGAVSVGNTIQNFSLGGNFQQNEFALSAYAAYVGRPLWFDLIATVGGLHDDTNRVVPIGIASISNTGSTNGANVSFAAQAGYDFRAALPGRFAELTYGPVGGVIVQYINIGGFSEADPFASDASGGFTALSFADQIRYSAITELGLQAGTDVGAWHPFGKLVWNHELVPNNRLVTASEPEIAFAPAFSMPAVSLGSDWATAELGTTVKLGRGVTGYVSFSGQIGQSNVAYYSGQIGLNVALDASRRPAAATP
jgi:outer membrane lipase/esterase